MGRKPNPLILEYFTRGPKLNDNSNRYPHTCKQCADSERMRALLELHGLKQQSQIAAQERFDAKQATPLANAPVTALPQGWGPLNALAEASRIRQVDLNEHSRGQKSQTDTNGTAQPAESIAKGALASNANTSAGDAMSFEISEQFSLNNPPGNNDQHGQGEDAKVDLPPTDMTPEERLQTLLPPSPPDPHNISVALAATARLNSQLLDPQLVSPGTADAAEQPPVNTSQSPTVDQNGTHAWGEMTYLSNTSPTSMLTTDHQSQMQMSMNRGGVRMDTSDTLLNGRPRNARARFTAARRKEVQEVRKIGACIRCRILRKNCGKGTPCDTCRKVLSPRVWKTGCVRSRLHEQLDLYSAGVQVVLSQNRINHLKDTLPLSEDGTFVKVSHFPETGCSATFRTLVAPGEAVVGAAGGGGEPVAKGCPSQTMMLYQDSEDIPAKVEAYVKEVFPLFVEKEPSKFVRSTLESATRQLSEGKDDDLLSKALELWGLVESIDRERQWTILETLGPSRNDEENPRSQWIKEPLKAVAQDVYGMICMQLNAAAERKANVTSRNLLNQMDRLLTDSKMKVGFKMFLTAVIFLNCVEKSTWAFMAWEQDHLRPGWPLERDPSVFTQQGGSLAGLLRMLLAIRKSLPQTSRSDDGRLVTSEEDVEVKKYFETIDLDCETPPFLLPLSPQDSSH